MKAKTGEPAVVTLPDFASDEEAAAWLESEEGRRQLAHAKGVRVKFVLKHPEFVSVTIRLPADLRARLRGLAEQKGMGYQTLARQWLLERYDEAKKEVTGEPEAAPSVRREWRDLANHSGLALGLSPRDREMLDYAKRGYTAFQIAHLLREYAPVHEVEASLAQVKTRIQEARNPRSRHPAAAQVVKVRRS